jgi:endogenous inhibitor of DNA gyrase (YacG/DUF329 family)
MPVTRAGGHAMSMVRCPICEKFFESAESKAMPFCSERCRRIDLHRWLGEEKYSVPVQRKDEEEEYFSEDEQ